MRVRLFELRLLAVALAALWALAGILVLVAYRPGGPYDLLVGIAASLPLLVSVPAIAWPPLVRTRNGAMAVMWLGFVAGVLLIPSLVGVAQQITSDSTDPLLPSLEVVYPWALALLATGLFVGLGVTRRVTGEVNVGRRRFGLSAAFALGTTVVIASAFTGASLADESALRQRPVTHSRFGPTDPSLDPPRCSGELRPATTARVKATFALTVDGRSRGDADLTGVRSGTDVSWTADVITPEHYAEVGVVRVGTSVWQKGPARGWARMPENAAADQLLDMTVFTEALAPANRDTAEELGLESVEGARARHCRLSVDAPLFVGSFPQVSWLIGDLTPDQWHGTVDYWIFGDGEVGMVSGEFNGSGSDLARGTAAPGVLGTLRVSLTATDRGLPATVSAP